MMFGAHTTTDAISAEGGVPLHYMTVVLEGDSIELNRDFGSWLVARNSPSCAIRLCQFEARVFR